jgi:hypothetical protein
MTRLSSLAMVIALTGALTGTVHAQSQAEIAAKLNEEGKELMYADKPAEAARKFQEAVARVPEAKYFVNLCAARLQEGKLDEALTACNAVELNNPSAEQKARADKLIGKIHEEAKAQNIELRPGGGGGGDPGVGRPPDPSNPSGPPPPRAVGRPLGQSLVMASTPDNRYTWTLGIELFGGGGQVGESTYYASTGGGFRVKTDYLLDPRSRLGVQGYVQLTHLEPGNNDSVLADSLDIVDIGGAGYKHFCLGNTPRMCVTPLAGAHLTLMSPANEMNGFGEQVFNYAALGARGELAITYAFGRRFEHALSVVGGANLYTPVLGGPSADDGSGSLTADEIGLDKAGMLAYLGLGYTYRFNTPLGSSPFIILE